MKWIAQIRSPWLRWAVVRIVIPVGWFASNLYLTRPSVQSTEIEFGLGALVLILYAILMDWPGKNAH